MGIGEVGVLPSCVGGLAGHRWAVEINGRLTIDTESPTSGKPSRSEVEKRDVRSCPGRYSYVGHDVDMEGDSGSLGGRAPDEPVMAVGGGGKKGWLDPWHEEGGL